MKQVTSMEVVHYTTPMIIVTHKHNNIMDVIDF